MRNPHQSTGVGASGDRRIQGSMSRNGSGEKKGSKHLQVGLSDICAFEQKMRRVADLEWASGLEPYFVSHSLASFLTLQILSQKLPTLCNLSPVLHLYMSAIRQ